MGEKRQDFEEQAVKRLTRFSAGARYQSAPDYYDHDPERQKNDDVSEEDESDDENDAEEESQLEQIYNPTERFQTIKETSKKQRKNYDGYDYTNHENTTTTPNNTNINTHDPEAQDSNVKFTEKYNDEKIRKQFRKSICPSNKKSFDQQEIDFTAEDFTNSNSDSSSESNTEQPTQNTTTCASNRSKKSYKSSKSSNNNRNRSATERSVENTINSNELSHLRLDKIDEFETSNRCANIETQTSCMILVTKDQVLESIRKNNVTPIPPRCITTATQTTDFVNSSNQQILTQLRNQIETGCFESPKQFFSSGKYREKKYNKRRYKNRSYSNNKNNGHSSDATLDNLASLQQDDHHHHHHDASSKSSRNSGMISSFHDNNQNSSSDFPEISEIEIDIAEEMELQARISLTDPVQYLVDEYNQRLKSRTQIQNAENQASDTFLPESIVLNRRESGNTVAMIQESIVSPTGISENECENNNQHNKKNVSITLPAQSNYDRFVSNTGIQGYDTPKNPLSGQFKFRSEDPFSTYGNVTKQNPENRMSVESIKGSVGVNFNIGNESFLNAGEMDQRNGRVSDFTEKSDVTESVGFNHI